jgi:hypothetical protein
MHEESWMKNGNYLQDVSLDGSIEIPDKEIM